LRDPDLLHAACLKDLFDLKDTTQSTDFAAMHQPCRIIKKWAKPV